MCSRVGLRDLSGTLPEIKRRFPDDLTQNLLRVQNLVSLALGPRGLAVDVVENEESLHELGIEPKPPSM